MSLVRGLGHYYSLRGGKRGSRLGWRCLVGRKVREISLLVLGLGGCRRLPERHPVYS